MQFVKNGPDVPEQLLQAHEDGRVVFFCGAGISYPAKLPGFEGLVKKAYIGLGDTLSPLEQSAFDKGEYDTTISLLEARRIDGRTAVRRAIANVLKPNLTAPNATRTHAALLTLARSRRGSSRLITTNFDRLFDHAANAMSLELDSYAAPLLPVPKKKWEGIVYLHGHLTDAPSSADLDRLVVSSGDFGLAYLTERWAARFVSELFRNHIVCFVGYSIADPVMRYMMDALAADRLLGEAPVEVYAFGSHKAGEEASAAAQWSAKNVTPILYRDDGGHVALHDTLHAWSETYRDGVRGKEAIVTRYASLLPVGSTAQDNFVGRMLWALCDESGLPAKAFSEHDPLPHLDWLMAFSDSRFGHRDLPRFGVPAEEALDGKLAYSLAARPASYTKTPWMRLVHRNDRLSTRWDNILLYLAQWLTRHLDDPKLLLWVVAEGGHLDEKLRSFIERALDQRPVSRAMDIMWRIILAGRLADNVRSLELYDWVSSFKRHGLTPLMRVQLREMLSPRIQMRQPYRWSEAVDEGEDGQEESAESDERIERLVDWELVLTADYVHSALDDVRKTPEWQAILPSLLSGVTSLLLETMDIMRSLGAADDIHDRSYWHRPSIVEHPQNQKFRDWTVLIELARDAWRAAAEATPEGALREVHGWFDLPYPVFKRLGFFAMNSRPDLFSGRDVVSKLLMEEAWWLWSVETQRETMRLVVGSAAELPKAQLHRLQRAIVQGPPSKMFRENDDPEQIQRVIDRKIWLRLTALRDAGAALVPAASARLQSLVTAYPGWEPATERDEFPVWMGTGDSWLQYSQTPKKVKDIVAWLREHRSVDLNHEDDWRERCRADFRRTAAALLHLATEGDWPTDRWRSALQAWAEKDTALRSWRWVSRPLTEAPNDVVSELSHSIAWWLKAVARSLNGEQEPFFVLVRRILAACEAEGDERGSDALTTAINHPVGMAVEAVLEHWFAGGLEDNQLLHGDVVGIFTTVCDLSVSVFRHARILLCSHVITLFRVDQTWTEEYLLPQFDWRTSPDTARQAWIGYLWSPRVYRPLLDAIKEPFLETARHVTELDGVSEQYASLLTYVSVELEGLFTKSELRSATAYLPHDVLERAIHTLIDGLEGAADRAPEYWRNRAKPYIINIWPASHEVRTGSISEKFAQLAIASGEMFPDAIATLRDWLVPIQHPSHVLTLLSDSKLCERFPSDALTLLDHVVNGEHPWGTGRLRECLGSISTAWPAAADDLRFQRLEVIMRQTGPSL